MKKHCWTCDTLREETDDNRCPECRSSLKWDSVERVRVRETNLRLNSGMALSTVKAGAEFIVGGMGLP